MNPPPYADLPAMQDWADALMASRPADFVIGDDYLRRWYVIPRNPWANIYLHDVRRSDDDRALHDHPWDNTSLILLGGYVEHTPDGIFARWEGDLIQRKPADLHRLVVPDGGRCVSLFMTGPKVRDWGFACPQGWVPWEEFTAPGDSSKTGRGCGE